MNQTHERPLGMYPLHPEHELAITRQKWSEAHETGDAALEDHYQEHAELIVEAFPHLGLDVKIAANSIHNYVAPLFRADNIGTIG